MNRLFAAAIIFVPVLIFAQVGDKYKLTSEKLDKQGNSLDEEILNLNKKIAAVIKKYNLLKTKDIRILPYQTTYNLGDNYIEIEKHLFTKDKLYGRKITGIKKKRIKIYTNGETISKIESLIFEKNFDSGEINEVFITDPSPGTVSTDDIIFTHKYLGKTIVNGKRLGDVKNTTANPVRNEIKQTFLVPHLNIFYNSLLFIASSYYKSLKDSDLYMSEFLKKSTRY